MKSKKVLIDDGLHPKFEQNLSSSAHNVQKVRDVIGTRVSDPVVAHYADLENAIVLTDDKNFRKVTQSDYNKFPHELSNKTKNHKQYVQADVSGYGFTSHNTVKFQLLNSQNNDDHITGIGDKSHNGIIVVDQNELDCIDDIQHVTDIIDAYLTQYKDPYIHKNHRMVRIL